MNSKLVWAAIIILIIVGVWLYSNNNQAPVEMVTEENAAAVSEAVAPIVEATGTPAEVVTTPVETTTEVPAK